MSRLTALSGAAVLTAGLSLPGLALAAADVTVPCPDAMVDSSAAIINALQSIGPGRTVRLEACTYYLSAPILITGTFDGALVGAGMGRTILTTLPDADGIEDVLMINWVTDLDNPGVFGPTLGPTLFHFSLFGEAPSQVAISNLSITITDPQPAFASARAAWFDGALLAMVTVEGRRVSTDFDQVEMKAARKPDGFPRTNVFYGIELWGELSYWSAGLPGTLNPMVGRHVLRRSVFEGLWNGYNFAEMADSWVMVRQSRFANLALDALDAIEGVDMVRSTLHVTQNDIELSGAASGIWLRGIDGALVNQNRVRGQAQVGIDVVSGTGYQILNNDLESLEAPPGSYKIVLEPGTSDSLVVGTNPAQVLDQGTNNEILGGEGKH
jgi:hypothetical protein